MLKAIEKAIQTSDLGLNPNNDGEVIRLIFPELNAERRKDLSKQVKKYAEEAKVAVRSIRRDAIEQIKKLKKASEITEDDQHEAEDKAQKLTDNAIKEVDAVTAAKEKEIMEI
jgi:ribosome recycling factor